MILWLHPFLKLYQLVSWTTSKPLYSTLSALHTLLPLMPWYRRCCVVRCFWGCECENTLILMAWHCRAEVLSEWIAAGIVCQGLYDWHKHHMLVCGELEVGRDIGTPGTSDLTECRGFGNLLFMQTIKGASMHQFQVRNVRRSKVRKQSFLTNHF